ncbi:hemolysin III family protein [Winogradskyella sp. PC-19]|uniref:PAQR family membrane homeostasis protein TrhA n=1 Tax=unclassified Winogradskyella TaxID=2615021 RepID=UPI000B3CA2D9|nr:MULTISPECIES: hemolysin III family protein [unclassified Winogradskyella]ARV08421.1 hemolysin III family protein [Winogradskyella sp. PC-19]RZN75026.1 MAG: hemolysin III family protein [Winogradskyella sp.]
MSEQSKKEELLNAWSHGFGAALGIVGLILLIINVDNNKPWHLFSVIVYGLSIIILFTASTAYHAISNFDLKQKFRVVDHISIYLLIAGTYTPVLLILLPDSLGWPLFYAVWGIAAFGVILKLFFTGRFEIFSTLLYLVMGWLIVFDFTTLSEIMYPNGILWLFAGGLFYTVGIVFYAIHKIPYNHVIWHFFVLGGAFCHFMMMFHHVA